MYVLVILLVTGITIFVLSLGEGTIKLINRELEMYEDLLELVGDKLLRKKQQRSFSNRYLEKFRIMLGIPGFYTNSGKLDIAGKSVLTN